MINKFKTVITDLRRLKMNLIPAATVEQIKKDEGLSLTAYQCSANKTTIGYGRNLEGRGITSDEAEYLLMNDIKITQKELRQNFDWFIDMNTARQGAMVNMCFNLGITRFYGFKKMIKAAKIGDHEEMAEQMLDSKWARQVGARADRLAIVGRTGK